VCNFSLNAQKKTTSQNKTIKIIAKEYAQEPCIIANYFGDSRYKIDSFNLDAKGEYIYKEKSDKPLKGGVYMLYFPSKQKTLDFLYSNDEPNLEIQVNVENPQISKAINSKENDLFFGEIKSLEPIYKRLNELSTQYKNETDSLKKNNTLESIRVEEKKMLDKRKEFISKNPNTFYAKLIKMMMEIDVPNYFEILEEQKRNEQKYYYFKDHYWDNIDFSDDRLLFTPIFESKFNNFFENVSVKHPDSLIREIDRVLGKIPNYNSDMFKYCLPTLLNKFANSKIMGQDAIYVHIVNKYYKTGLAKWSDSANIKKIIEDASDLEPLLIGKYAPNFEVLDTTLDVKNKSSLYGVKSKYKILVFWNPECGHCKKEIPVLDSLYPELKKRGAEVFPVSTIVKKDNQIDLWKKFIRDNKLKFKNYADPEFKMNPLFVLLYHIKSTPEYYILDEKNKIIAKKLSPDQMVDFLDNFEKFLLSGK
jgi:peroxiredoxin